MTWGNFHLLYLLVLVPIMVIIYAIDGQRRRKLLEKIGHLPMVARMTRSASPGRRRVRAVLNVTAVTMLMVALGQPQVPGRARLTESRGLDLVVALDFSRSMLARDIYPSRLERAKAELGRFIDTLHGDRVGLVAFAGETLSYPLTVDYEAAKLFWRDMGPDDMPLGGTDLGRAISASTELLLRVRHPNDKNAKLASQVIVLLTDGEDTEGRGLTAAKEAAKQNIRIYTLGIGSNERPYVQLYDEGGKPTGFINDASGQPVRVGLDDASLKQIAQISQGDYIPLDPRRFGMERLQHAIAGLERTMEEARLEREPEDVGRWFLVPAFICLLAGALLGERKREPSVVSTPVPATKTRGFSPRAAAALLLFLFPFVTGFDLFKRLDPNIEAGNRALAAGKADEALKAYDRAVEAMPDEPVAHFDRGQALSALGRHVEAQKEFQRASEGHDPEVKADSYYNMGNALFEQQRFKDAADAYKHTLGLRSDDKRAKWNLELALKRMIEEKQKQDQKDQDKQGDQKKQAQDQKQPQDQKQQDDKKQPQNDQKQPQDPKQEDQQQDQAQKPKPKDEEKNAANSPDKGQNSKEEEKEKKKTAAQMREPPKEIDKQDAEAVLDALERVEPTVQKDLARKRASNRRPSKDW